MRTKGCIIFTMISWIILLIGFSAVVPHVTLNPLQFGSFNAALSTNPANPELLNASFPVSEAYSASSSYYFKTNGSALSSRYSVIGLQPPGNRDYSLYFSNNNFTTYIRNSTRAGNGVVEWVIFRPSSSQPLYARVTTANAGTAAIEWEDSVESLVNGSLKSNTIDATNAIEIYAISMVNTSTYQINLAPSGGNLDLYLYSLAPGVAANIGGAVRASNTGGNNVMETIMGFSPNITDQFAVLVVRVAGAPVTYTLTLNETGNPPTNPVNPEDLTLGNPINEPNYLSGKSYYYRTAVNVNPARYNVIWTQPSLGNQNLNLNISSTATYTTSTISARATNGLIEWVVFRPSTAQVFYAKVTDVNLNGAGAIEWEDSTEVLTTSASKSSSSLSTTNAIEVYGVTLKKTSIYRINLTVPATGDFDLYLYSLTSGAAADPNGFIRSSTSAINVENITGFSPSSDGDFAILVVWVSGSGEYTLTLEENSTGGLPSTGPSNLWLFPVIEIPVFFGVAFGLVGILYLHKYLKNRPKSGEGN